jgi:hypothetical protein
MRYLYIHAYIHTYINTGDGAADSHHCKGRHSHVPQRSLQCCCSSQPCIWQLQQTEENHREHWSPRLTSFPFRFALYLTRFRFCKSKSCLLYYVCMVGVCVCMHHFFPVSTAMYLAPIRFCTYISCYFKVVRCTYACFFVYVCMQVFLSLIASFLVLICMFLCVYINVCLSFSQSYRLLSRLDLLLISLGRVIRYMRAYIKP